MYNGNTNIVHAYPTVTVKYITAIQTLFIHTFVLPLYISQSQKGMHEQCLYCRYAFHSHSRVCMNSVCIAVIHFYIPYCDCEMYNGNTNIVHTYPTVTVKYKTAIQTLFIHTLLWLKYNVCIAVIHFTVTVGYLWTVCVLLLYIS
jgi:hypothetical protein